MIDPDPAVLAQQHAEAYETVQSLIARAGPSVAFVTVDETQHTDWGKELRGAAADVVFSVLTRGEHDASGPDSTTLYTHIAACDAAGTPLASLRAVGWYGRALLPVLADWARQTGRSGVWRHKGATRVTFDGRYPLQHPPVVRGAPALCAELAAEGWRCTPDADGVTLVRSRTGRDLPMTFLVVTLSLMLFPLMALVGVVLVVRRVANGRWDVDAHTVQPWKRVEDRLTLRVTADAMTLQRDQAGRTQYAHRWTPDTLLLLYAEPRGAGDPELALVERDRVRVLPMLLRGEVRHTMHAMKTPALVAELAALYWTPRAASSEPAVGVA